MSNWNPADFLITKNNLRALVKQQMDYADHMLKDPPRKDLPPTLLVQTKVTPCAEPERTLVQVVGDFNAEEGKHAIMRAMGRIFYKQKALVQAFVLATEAWISTDPGVEAPSRDPLRQEAIVVAGFAKLAGGHTALASMPVTRHGVTNVMIPGTWTVVEAEGKSDFPLLEQFYRGFFEEVARKEGLAL